MKANLENTSPGMNKRPGNLTFLPIIGVVLAASLVLLIEAVFVMATGYRFPESMIGGLLNNQLSWRTFLLLLLLLPTVHATMIRFGGGRKSRNVAFIVCVGVFAALACSLSVTFHWTDP